MSWRFFHEVVAKSTGSGFAVCSNCQVLEQGVEQGATLVPNKRCLRIIGVSPRQISHWVLLKVKFGSDSTKSSVPFLELVRENFFHII